MNGVLGSFHHCFLNGRCNMKLFTTHSVHRPAAKEVVGRCLFLEEGDAPFPDDKWRFLLIQPMRNYEINICWFEYETQGSLSILSPFFEYSPILRDFGIRSWNFTNFSPKGKRYDMSASKIKMHNFHQTNYKTCFFGWFQQRKQFLCSHFETHRWIQQVFTQFPPAFW